MTKMKKSTIISMACAAVAVCSPLASNAQTVAADSVMQHARGSRLSVGGYGEVAYSRNFYSDSGNRYSSAKGLRSRSDVSPTYVPAISSCP